MKQHVKSPWKDTTADINHDIIYMTCVTSFRAELPRTDMRTSESFYSFPPTPHAWDLPCPWSPSEDFKGLRNRESCAIAREDRGELEAG